MRRNAKWLFLLAIAAPTALAIGFGERKLTAELVDVDTGKPIEGAGYTMLEYNRVKGLPRGIPLPPHAGSQGARCLRSTSVRNSSTTSTQLTLAAKSVAPHEKLLSDGTTLAIYAYAPGYCVGEFNEERGPRLSIEGGVSSSIDKGSGRVTLRTRLDTGDPELRIRYLRGALAQLSRCGDSDPELDALKGEIQSEIQALERSLGLPQSGRGFIIQPENSREPPDWSPPNAACGPGDACFSVAPAVRRSLMLVCNGETGCDLDRRYSNGKTALYQYLHAADPERSILLLKAGADPNVELYPGGPTGVDKLLEYPLDEMRAPAALEIVNALVQDGRATISSRTAKRLSTHWKNGPAEEVRVAASKLPVRPSGPAAICRPVPYRTDGGATAEEY